ncbi:hypothetical protein APHAL10511_003140 [Amanita phalloides]|nr:hypothetical protein APHAL10511_003140 [Amanita phalloides]
MSDDNSMDVKYDLSRASPPISRDIRDALLPQVLVDEFKTATINVAKRKDWSDRLISAENDEEKLQYLSTFFIPTQG